MLAITKASLLATFKSPQSIFFGLFFPIVLIVIFGSLSRGGSASINVAFAKGQDSTTELYRALKAMPVLKFADPQQKDTEEELRKGRITAIMDIRKTSDDANLALFDIHLRTTSASQRDLPILNSVLRDLIHDANSLIYPQ